MDPSHSELSQIAAAALPLQALLDFIGMDEPVKAALWDALGGVSKVREIVFVPSEDWDDAVKEALVTTTAAVAASEGVVGQPAQTRKLKPIEKAQVGMLRGYARLLCGLTGDEAGGGLSQVHGTAQATAGNAAAVTAKNAHKRTFKLSSVVDQGDDQEVVRPSRSFGSAMTVSARPLTKKRPPTSCRASLSSWSRMSCLTQTSGCCGPLVNAWSGR